MKHRNTKARAAAWDVLRAGCNYTGHFTTILRTVAASVGLAPEAILRKDRRSEPALARQLAVYLCAKHTGAADRFLAPFFGQDRAYIRWARLQIAADIQNYPARAALVAQIEAQLPDLCSPRSLGVKSL